jgi:hypothetical protein
MNIQLQPSGHIAELQIHHADIVEFEKHHNNHGHYDYFR